MGQYEIEKEIDASIQKIKSILSKKLPDSDIEKVVEVLKDLKGKIHRGII